MAQVINTNVSSLYAQAQLNNSQKAGNTALERLSTGLRINSAKDDAAGLSIGSRLTSQINGMNQAIRNANDGVSLVQTAEGALTESTKILQRLRELAVQSANATNSADDRKALNTEANQLKTQLNSIATNTAFNNVKLLDGNFTNNSFQVGSGATETLSVSINNMGGGALGVYKVQASQTDTANQGSSSIAVGTAGTSSPTGAIAAQTITVNGANGSADVTSGSAGTSAYTIAANVNAVESSTGVNAKAANKALMDTFTVDGTVSFKLNDGSGNESTISATITTTNLTNLRDAINNASGTTGVTATGTGNALTLTQADGKNIGIHSVTHSGMATGGSMMNVDSLDSSDTSDDTKTFTILTTGLSEVSTGSATISGYVTFSDDSDFSVSSSVSGTAGSIFAVTTGANANTTGTQSKLSNSTLDTQANALAAIDVIDAALNKVNAERATLGALQNRFDSTISSLSNTSTNLESARSRIMDADFAAETAALSKSQILQQAGISVLAQANAQPQNVLALLQ